MRTYKFHASLSLVSIGEKWTGWTGCQGRWGTFEVSLHVGCSCSHPRCSALCVLRLVGSQRHCLVDTVSVAFVRGLPFILPRKAPSEFLGEVWLRTALIRLGPAASAG